MSEAIEQKSRLNEIPLVMSKGPQLSTVADAWSLGQMYHKAGMVPRGVKSAAELMIILMAGAELGFGPTWSLRNIASFNGQAMIHSDGPISLVMRSGQLEWQQSGHEGAGESLTAWFEVKRKGVDVPVRREFSVRDAKTAGLWDKGIWKQYPSRMLLMRARAFALRDLFADVLGGIGILEEHVGNELEQEQAVGSAGLLSALKAEPVPVEALPDDGTPDDGGSWEPSPEEVAEIQARDMAEAGLFGEQS